MTRNTMPLLFFLSLFLGTALEAWSQNKCWVFFKTKAPRDKGILYISDKTLYNRALLNLESEQFSDLPVDKRNIEALEMLGIRTVATSKWLNAVSAHLDEETLQRVKNMSFVDDVFPMRISTEVAAINAFENEDWTMAIRQINGNALLAENLDGTGVDVGIIDGGFKDGDVDPSLQHLIKKGNVRATRDFVSPQNQSVFRSDSYEVSGHGTRVWRMIAGVNKEGGAQYGLATNSGFYLARTDNADREFRGEEDFWIAALEWMDSLGIRLVNTSLGYSLDFDDPKDNYKPSQMDGATTAIAKAADLAVREKGMIIVKSTGNDGENPAWRVLSTPGDAKNVICVGATDNDHWIRPEFSGIGPEFLSYLKPNMACATPGGTSYSAPVIAGLVACILQRKPGLSSSEVQDILERSCHLYPYGNNYIGYGVPDAEKVRTLLRKGNTNFGKSEKVMISKDVFNLDLGKYNAASVTVFSKKNKYHVVGQEVLTEKKITISRRPDITHTTLAFKDHVIEIEWK